MLSLMSVYTLADIVFRTVQILVIFGPFAAASPYYSASKQYDYIVIGGGTAGLTVASRLAEHASVAVIEAGGNYEIDSGNVSTLPGLALSQPFLDTTPSYTPNSLVDWNYVSTPQAGAGNRTIHYAQGKTLSGSSGINICVYHRGTLGAYQQWADLVDDQSYTYSELLPYFKSTATLTPPNFPKRRTPNATFGYDTSAFNNTLDGPVQVSWAIWQDTTVTWLARAIESIGLPLTSIGFSSGQLTGVSAYIQTTVDTRIAVRSSAETAYLDNVGVPAGLKVYRNAFARKILFSGNCATGVEIEINNKTLELTAKKEVILSAGAFGSPHLLMVSGIGPAATLETHDIDVVSDLPGVGQNLWDQIYLSVIRPVSTPNGALEIANNPAEVERQYREEQWGPLSSVSAYMAFEKIPDDLRTGFSNGTRSALNAFPEDWPEIEYIVGSGAGPNGSSLAVINGILVAPLSRGNLTIASADPTVRPVMDLGWLTHPADGEVLIAAVKRARQAFDNLTDISTGPEILPGEDVQTDEQILDFIRNAVTPIWHAGATCAMGQSPEDGAVVDSNAKVFGVHNLRVVDASAFPFMVPGHPQSTVYAFAEKIAGQILHEGYQQL